MSSCWATIRRRTLTAPSGVTNRQPEGESDRAWAPTVCQRRATTDAERSTIQWCRGASSSATARIDAERRTKRWAFSGQRTTYQRSARNVSWASERCASTPRKRASTRTWPTCGPTTATRRKWSSVPVADHGAFSPQRSRWTTAKRPDGRRPRSGWHQRPVDTDEPAGEHASSQWTCRADG